MTPDEKADRIIKGMVATGVAAGGVPVPLLIPFMGAVAGGVVAIGTCYGVELSKRDAWKLIRQFFKAAGFVYMSALVGGQFMVWLLTPTGLGTPAAMALDAVTSAAVAYAAGTAAKHYFKGHTSQAELRAIVRGAVVEARRNLTTGRETK
ncbi:DUF697 domain-containing protein [Amorphoplanes digitatis]|uniref:Uncharacterized protein n=1 Tax=Actinoplanes digitatis TaxID=1868 RepID=A0A7W7HY22_9ACTN|nr:DUF697 domain-containing protein [Actinoplanes digitatis]MBB4762897.1 hypothetical protein [Actinoplanes digitatis]GID91608.1 hypothetical protein Adi01nite_10200 [Actinoplanes digitatis]